MDEGSTSADCELELIARGIDPLGAVEICASEEARRSEGDEEILEDESSEY